MNETWLSKQDTTNLEINGFCSEFIPGNKTRNTAKGRYSGGIAFYYKNTFQNYVKIVQKEQCGILWIKISKELFPFDQDVFICHTYVPPSVSKNFQSSNIDMFENLEIDIIKYNDLGKVYITGDFNSRTSDSPDFFEFDKYLDQNLSVVNTRDIPTRVNKDRVIDYNGRCLLELCQATGLLLANGRALNDRDNGKITFCSFQGQSTVDYLLLNFSDFDTLSHFDILDFNEHSDHAPVSFHIYLESHIHENPLEESISRKLVWDSTKVTEFNRQLMNNYEHIQHMTYDLTNQPIDHVVKEFTQFIHDNAFDVFGTTYRSKSCRSRPGKVNREWFDENCVSAKHEFTTARNRFNRDKNEQTRLNFIQARTSYNRVKRKAYQAYKIKEGRRINNLAKSNPRKFWKNINRTYKKSSPTPDSLTVDELYNHFENVFGEQSLNPDNIEPDINQSYSEDLDANFTESELRSAIFSQNNNKMPGIDNIPSEILKASYDVISPLLLSLYNRMYATGEYPRSWGDGIINPIFKKGDINDAQNYRGITLINVLAKVYSQLLLNRLTKWSEKYDKISSNQFGFQKGKSIVDCIFILHSVISKVINSGEKLYCVFIDYEKCFDKVDRSLLWQKLLSENVSCKLVKAIKSMYNTVKLCIKYKSSFSQFFDSHIGLKQGDPSSPLLFMLFVNDIIDNINSDLSHIFSVNELKLFLILYADDQVVFATSPQTLQSLLTDIENYCRIWGLKINTSKTKAMIFEKGKRTHYDFSINNNILDLVDSFKYLGITLFKNGNWYRSQKCIAQHASFALYNLFSIFQKVELPVTQKCKLFDTLVGSILNFGSEIWGIHGASDVELIHTKFLRRVLGVKKSTNLTALYGEMGRVPLTEFRKINMIKYWMKILRQKDSSLVKMTYLMLKDDTDLNLNYNGQNWAFQIKSILQHHGFEYVWNNQFDIEIPYQLIKQRVFDNYFQKWYCNINNSSRLQSYCIFKHNFESEKYLTVLSENKYRVALSRFRTSSHNLSIETGRYDSTPREQRICKSCNMNKIEDEYHFLLVCPNYRQLRMKYLKPYFCHWPSLYKFEILMSSTSKKSICNLAKLIYFATKRRNS